MKLGNNPRQFHWVVMYDESTNTWELDIDTTLSKFDDQAVYQNDTWIEAGEDYYAREEQLAILLNQANKEN